MAGHFKRLWQTIALAALAVVGMTAEASSQQMMMAGIYPPDDPAYSAIQDFAKRVEKETDGRVRIKTFPSGELGDYTNVFSELRRGTIQLALMTFPSQFDTRLELVSLPYIETTTDEVRKELSRGGYVRETMAKMAGKLGVTVLGDLYPMGFGGIGLTKKPEDLFTPGTDKDTLLRIPPMDIYRQIMKDLGYNTVTINFADLSSALQTGVVDGWVGGNALINYVLFRDVLKYYIVNNLYYETHGLMMSTKALEKLSKEDQQTVRKIAQDITSKAFDNTTARENSYLKKMEDKGIKVIRFDDAQVQEWAQYVRKHSWSAASERLSPEIMKHLRQIDGPQKQD